MNELNLFLKILCLVFALMPVYGFSQVSKKDSIQTETHVSKKLDEVVVKGKRQVIKYLGNKMIYYVNKDPEAKGLKFFDVLRKMPIIQVQDNDQITIQGNKSFKVLFNGKEDKVFNNNLKEFIKSIPADEIDRFEVIMEPDPKYTQEGYTKVLNIVTVSGGRLKGFTSTYRENMDNHQTNDASIFSCIQNTILR